MINQSTEKVGFALLLLGIIFSVRQELISGIGIILGTIGLILVLKSYTQDK